MATTTKKGSKRKTANPRRAVAKTSAAKQAQTNVELRQQLAESLLREEAKDAKLQERDRQLAEALEQQTATSEILAVIASSPRDIQPVLDTVVKSAARLCDSTDAQIFRVNGNVLKLVATHGSIPLIRGYEKRPIVHGLPIGRCVIDRKAIHIHDGASSESQAQFPQTRANQSGTRTFLAVPLLKEGVAIGVIRIRRTEVRPFSSKQIALLKTFADQAVIAIENVRLFKELDIRNRDLTEALEQQTATSDILRVIASSPTDVQPVLDVVAESAARLCEANNSGIWRTDGKNYWLVASHGPVPIPGGELVRLMTRGSNVARAMIDRETVHTPDMSSPDAQAEFPQPAATAQQTGVRTVLIMPLLREGVSIGAIHVRRTEVRPFTDKQIALLKTFADQAVIAIENVRLFKELQERNAELREAWSIRRRRPRCSASSAARRRTCSRCSTPSSRAPRGFVGSMT